MKVSIVGWQGDRMIELDGEPIGSIDGGFSGPFNFTLFDDSSPTGWGYSSPESFSDERSCAFAACAAYKAVPIERPM